MCFSNTYIGSHKFIVGICFNIYVYMCVGIYIYIIYIIYILYIYIRGHKWSTTHRGLPQSHCGDNREGTLFSWLHIIYIYIYMYKYVYNLEFQLIDLEFFKNMLCFQNSFFLILRHRADFVFLWFCITNCILSFKASFT